MKPSLENVLFDLAKMLTLTFSSPETSHFVVFSLPFLSFQRYFFLLFLLFLYLSFFPKDSYLGVLRLFLRVLEVARSRRLGIVGEVSVGPDSEVHKKSTGVTKPVFFWKSRSFLEIPFFCKNSDGRFPY